MRVNFTGLYLIKFPNTESKKSIQDKKNILENEIKSKKLDGIMYVNYRENVEPAKDTQNTSDIMLVSSIDNPQQLHSVFSKIGLGDEYINKTKIYLEA